MTESSIAIDTGDSVLLPPDPDPRDRDGNVRVVGDAVDLGAYEFQSNPSGAETRSTVGEGPVLLGNFDPYNILVKGTVEDVERMVAEVAGAGVDALWPGCDIWPTVPKENMQALMRAVVAIRC